MTSTCRRFPFEVLHTAPCSAAENMQTDINLPGQFEVQSQGYCTYLFMGYPFGYLWIFFRSFALFSAQSHR